MSSFEGEHPNWNRVFSIWRGFVSLVWYDGLIEFIFRFVAKTSEPLLAAGLVISAADFLTKGTLMHNNLMFAMAWAWTQAVAIEASSGVVFVYGLQSFKLGDKVKAWLYIVLSILLALTGGAMLFLQFMNNTTGLIDSSVPGAVTYILGCLRVIVSIGYVFMCRAKYIQFTSLFSDQPIVQPVQIEQPKLEEVIERLEDMYNKRLDIMIQEVTRQVSVTIEQNTAPRLPAITESTLLAQQSVNRIPKKVQTVVQSEAPKGTKSAMIQAYLEQEKMAGRKPTLQQIMDSQQCSKGTAIDCRKKVYGQEP